MAIVCAGRDSNTSSRLLLFGEINRIHLKLLRDCFTRSLRVALQHTETFENAFCIISVSRQLLNGTQISAYYFYLFFSSFLLNLLISCLVVEIVALR